MTKEARAILFSIGAQEQPMAPIGSGQQSPGTELVIPAHAFPVFDALRLKGDIKVTAE